MAASLKTLDSDVITLRQINIRSATNGYIPNRHILISDGIGDAYWNSISSIYANPYDTVADPYGSTLAAKDTNNTLRFRTSGVDGLLNIYVNASNSTLTFSNAAPNTLVSQTSVPIVSRTAAIQMPNSENITMSTSQSTLKFVGVGDIQLSTITDLRTVFFSISSFTSAGYADLSAVGRGWIGYEASSHSTSVGYASFVSSIPYSTTCGAVAWDWSRSIGSNIAMSTVEAYPSYSTGDVYFSTVQFNIAPFIRYINPNSTTRMFLEVNPNYLFQRMYLGKSSPMHLVKNFSSFVQYETTRGPQILEMASQGSYMLSQQSNAYSSNYFNTQVKLELDVNTVARNASLDGVSAGYYTLYHRIPAAMASLESDGYCGQVISGRGGFSNSVYVNVDNYTPLSNAVFLHIYNQN
ncbi:hypothetical protein EBR66_05050 [bacterium]|nr:hypothetical protein [bacterium]